MKKLIRDFYVDIIEASRLTFIDNKAVKPYVEKKISEELLELKETDYTDVSEYADVIEVLIRMATLHDISEADIQEERLRKARERGLFYSNIILTMPE